MLFWLHSPSENHLFYVVVQDLRGVPAKIFESMQVALDEGIDVGGEGEFHIPHAGIPKDHAETVQSSWLAIHFDAVAFSPVHLGLYSGFRLIPEYCWNARRWPDLPDILLDYGVATGEALLQKLAVYTGCTERIFANSVGDVFSERIKFA